MKANHLEALMFDILACNVRAVLWLKMFDFFLLFKDYFEMPQEVQT
jgi:hypothetical protein